MTPERKLRLVEGPLQEEWVARAACLGSDVEVFFRGKGSNATEVKSICAGCPVREECLEYALEAGEDHGVWGGCCRQELRAIRRARRGAA